MKRLFGIVIVLGIAAAMTVSTGALSPDELFSDSAVLIDAESGQVLYSKNMDQKMYPASTTKIMTALLVTELGDVDSVMSASKKAVTLEEKNSSTIDLEAGEHLTVDEALYALMLPSANEAANVLAEHISGTTEDFVAVMNARADTIGLKDTNYENPHGLHQDGHYTTAYDLAMLTREAAKSPLFMRYMSTPEYTMAGTDKHPAARKLTNGQSMIVPDDEYFDPDVISGKIGYTLEARYTMSSVAERDGRRLICVVMRSNKREQKFLDTEKLLEYGFSRFRKVTLSKSIFEDLKVNLDESSSIGFITNADFTAWLREDIGISQVRVALPSPEELEETGNSPYELGVVVNSFDSTLPALLGKQPVESEFIVSNVAVLMSVESVQKKNKFVMVFFVIFSACLGIILSIRLGLPRQNAAVKDADDSEFIAVDVEKLQQNR